MSRRDYFARPVRSDRTHHEYGHNRIEPTPTKFSWGQFLLGLGSLAMLAVAAVGFIVILSTPR